MDGKINVSIDKDKLKKDRKWDGLKGYITNTKLTSADIIENYNNLWKIEKAFRLSKTDLKIRPVYHRLKERIESHICISFMAYLVFKKLEKVLYENGSRISINEAIKNINKMYEINIKHRPIRLKNNDIQREILSIINENF